MLVRKSRNLRCVAPDGEIYGFARFSECYHCSAYPKIYLRQDWMDKLGLKMPETTEELREVLRAFVNDDPNGNGKKDEIGMLGGTTWNTMVEYALMGMSFQTVKPDFWLSLGADGKSVEFSPSTDAYREGLRYIKSLYDEGLIDGASFTQKEDQLAQTVRTEPHVVGMYVCGHAGQGYDNNDPAEAENYQIMIPVAGPDGFRRQGQNADEGEITGFHAVITDACKYPEDQTAEIKKGAMMVGPQADLAPFRLSMLPEVDDIYQPGNYEQRITLDTRKVEPYFPKERLDYTVFVPLDMADDYAEIQTNLNSFVRMATVQFITGERDIETGWDQYLSELDSYRVDRYIEIYKTATGR